MKTEEQTLKYIEDLRTKQGELDDEIEGLHRENSYISCVISALEWSLDTSDN